MKSLKKSISQLICISFRNVFYSSMKSVNSILGFFFTSRILNQVLNNLRRYFNSFYKLSECVASLDTLISSVSYCSTTYPVVRPTFGKHFELFNHDHPILKKLKEEKRSNNRDVLVLSQDRSITNDLFLTDKSSFLLITGTNMSGKSTFLKQIGMLQIMAQCGIFVPASKASFNIIKQVFSFSEDNESNVLNASSFEREMLEINYIFESIKSNSLVLIDELCRSTNYYEGLAVSMAIAEHLILILNNQFSYTDSIHIFYTTHFRELEYLEWCFPKTHNCYMETEVDASNRLIHSYKLKKGGVCKIENYGIFAINPCLIRLIHAC
jgi:DNA mismatch repair protein MSH4